MSGSVLDLITAAWVNIVTSIGLLIGYAMLKNQPMNFRVYFPIWFLKGKEPKVANLADGSRYVNLNVKSYAHVMDWIWITLRMPEAELIEHAGLDSAVFLRVLLLGLKIFMPMTVWGLLVLIPVNKTDNQLATYKAAHPTTFTYSSVDTLSISNVQDKSNRTSPACVVDAAAATILSETLNDYSHVLWAHLTAAYLFSGWTCLMLFMEYSKVENMRYVFLASMKQKPDQFTVLVRQMPRNPNESRGLQIEHFFRETHFEYYCTHQVVYNANKVAKLIGKKEKMENKLDYLQEKQAGQETSNRPTIRKGFMHLYGEKVDAIDFYTSEIHRLTQEIYNERKEVLSNQKYVMRAAFVSFTTRWGAAVCAQTQQSRDPTKWLTEWAPEPRDVYWANLPIPYVELNIRRLGIGIAIFVLVFFYMIPVTFVQSLANLDSLEKTVTFLRPLINKPFMRSFLQGFLPTLVLKLFLALLPQLLILLTKFEGYVSRSTIDRFAATKYFTFMVVNVFFGNVIVGSLFQQLKQYISSPTKVPAVFGTAVPMKATFFITYSMLDGWSSLAAEIFRLWPMVLYHLKNAMLVKTDKDRLKAIPATGPGYNTVLPHLGLYFLLGLVYAIISPLILPFIMIFFGFGYIIYRNQVINVYQPKYESAASFWPLVHRHIIIALIIKHITLIGLFSLKKAIASTPFLLPLPILTIIFHMYCRQRFGLAFQRYPLQEARCRDRLMETQELDRSFLDGAYLHPAIKSAVVDDEVPAVIKDGSSGRRNLDGTNSSSNYSENGVPLVSLQRARSLGVHSNSPRGAADSFSDADSLTESRRIYLESGNSRQNSSKDDVTVDFLTEPLNGHSDSHPHTITGNPVDSQYGSHTNLESRSSIHHPLSGSETHDMHVGRCTDNAGAYLQPEIPSHRHHVGEKPIGAGKDLPERRYRHAHDSSHVNHDPRNSTDSRTGLLGHEEP